MCWDISLHSDIEIIKKAFPKLRDERKQLEIDMYRMENVQAILFPEYPIIYREKESGDLVLKEMEWGVFPTYLSDPREQIDRRRNQVNIRTERVINEKKSVWYRLRNQRCLIPVSGTYEHRKIKGWSKKVPYYISLKDRDFFFIPGLYQWHETVDADGVVERIGSFGLMTRTANEAMGQIHNDGANRNRMPLFLPEQLEREWLSGIQDIDMAQIFEFEMSQEDMDYYPVYTLRGYPERPDGSHRYEPYNWEGLPPLGNDDPASVQRSLF